MMTDCGVNETEHHEVVLPAGEMGGGGQRPREPRYHTRKWGAAPDVQTGRADRAWSIRPGIPPRAGVTDTTWQRHVLARGKFCYVQAKFWEKVVTW